MKERSTTIKTCYSYNDSPQDLLDIFISYAWQFIGTVYVWGGKELKADRGYDCSGYVQECMEAVGIMSSGINNSLSSMQMFHRLNSLSTRRTVLPHPGDLLFFGKDVQSINHVAIAISPEFMIEAGGGSDKLLSSGMVRIRPIRKDLIAVINTLELLERKVRL